MGVQKIKSFAAGAWVAPDAGARPIEHAVTGAVMAEAGAALDMGAMLDHARNVGGPALRALTFHDRARMLKALAMYLSERKDPLYDLSFNTGATQKDHLIDIDGGIGATFVFASKGRREMPDAQVYLDGPVEQLSRSGTFLGRHIAVPKRGVAVHINAFNFPVWGMMEKLAPALLAGMPCIVKPATATCYVTELAVRMMLESGLLPEGALQLICGGTGDLLDRLGGQDVVSFTGSAQTAAMLKATPSILAGSVPFIAEQDSLNAAILGPDAAPGSPEFDIFIKEATREITVKAGQKCTAMRRLIVPDPAPVIEALSARLAGVRIGDPRSSDTQMGAIVSASQRDDVAAKAAIIATEAALVFDGSAPEGFVAPRLFHCADPDAAQQVHAVEAFGPVSTVMGYRDLDHAAELANRGEGSLVASVFTRDPDAARHLAIETASHHGRLYFNNRDSAKEATGHGSPLPHMVHGGPGRAGGGEEQGGIRGVMHYMQRTAVQGSPDILTAVAGDWVPGAQEIDAGEHPFRRAFDTLQIGETIHTAPRVVTLEDIEHFAHFTGDTFYGHMDEEAAAANPFFPGRVAHGYLLLSFAAGLFVDPDPGPVLANTGLDNLRFMSPVSPGDAIKARLTVKRKTGRNEEYGEVRWHVTLTNQDGEICAEYELLTMNSY
ncbi:Phenylacetic acid degradation protein PaaN, ring-opening aldehyde dehydrogenase [Candidatus Rhodobacter oscarellae]|uniref:Phenylacetic acid degradation protein PaaN, ring-opening aldehyde dehydrogenase n=1 Tax=Candidatus Rhodobacter oscarellae TaxID=1675527 RepID=A0A0J9H3N4_9RHOB|nr:phenylacetic acid degradation bifunctional protein PaaZ [Candidatus Rhodobacter lobularis]KMW60288.1 Phenylacetic acid degradation protein PaaN, ring-opening aldehyde dehydrogenase [Candidatus Rhodobacter lobularis]